MCIISYWEPKTGTDETGTRNRPIHGNEPRAFTYLASFTSRKYFLYYYMYTFTLFRMQYAIVSYYLYKYPSECLESFFYLHNTLYIKQTLFPSSCKFYCVCRFLSSSGKIGRIFMYISWMLKRIMRKYLAWWLMYS